jgi:hypothetical protein
MEANQNEKERQIEGLINFIVMETREKWREP